MVESPARRRRLDAASVPVLPRARAAGGAAAADAEGQAPPAATTRPRWRCARAIVRACSPMPRYRTGAAKATGSRRSPAPGSPWSKLRAAMEEGTRASRCGKSAATTGFSRAQLDALAVEEPLEVRLAWRERDATDRERAIAVTMRTPGHDAGARASGSCTARASSRRARGRRGLRGRRATWCGVELAAGVRGRSAAALERNFYVTLELRGVRQGLASTPCGCDGRSRRRRPGPRLEARAVQRMPEALRAAQSAFDATGGLHAAALFDARGRARTVREDVGRHNAVDKVVGAALLAGAAAAAATASSLLSGRASFELMQKAAMAGVAGRGRGGRALEPRRGARARGGHHPARLRARRALQRLHGRRSASSERGG